MINIDYRIHPNSLKKAKSSNLKTADSMTLHYDHFLGDILLRVGGYDLNADWGWVPVLDFAVCMKEITSSLEDGNPQIFEFTESDAYIKMEREGNTVLLSTNYGPDPSRIRIDYDHFSDAVERFCKNLIIYLTNELPELNTNSYIQTIKKNMLSPPTT